MRDITINLNELEVETLRRALRQQRKRLVVDLDDLSAILGSDAIRQQLASVEHVLSRIEDAVAQGQAL